MTPLLHPPHLLRLAEDARFALAAIEAAAAGIAASMRARTLDPDDAYHLLHLIHESTTSKLDTLVEALSEGDAAGHPSAVKRDLYALRQVDSGTTAAPSRNRTK